MRNISQTIFNINKMEKIIKTLPELKSIIDANKYHTFDYTEGLSISDGIEIFEIDLEETDDYQGASATLCIYPNEDILFNDIKSNIKSMELEEGADDQYYDYSPSQVEAIIYAIPQLTPEHQDYIITGLKKHLQEFIQDEEQDEDMISQYTATYNALEKWESDKRETQLFDSLAVSELIRQLNK
jgi:hypothetical protein